MTLRNSQQSIGDPIIAACKESFENNFTAKSPSTQRENFLRIPERGILRKESAVLSKGLSAVFVADLIRSIFPLLRGKYYNKILSDLSGSRDPEQSRRGTGGEKKQTI